MAQKPGRAFRFLMRIGYACLAIIGALLLVGIYLVWGEREKERTKTALQNFAAYCVMTGAMPPQLMASYAASQHLQRMPSEAEQKLLSGQAGYAWYLPLDKTAAGTGTNPSILISRAPATCTIVADGIDPALAHSLFATAAERAYAAAQSAKNGGGATFEKIPGADRTIPSEPPAEVHVKAYFIGESGKNIGLVLTSSTYTASGRSSLRYTFALAQRPAPAENAAPSP